MKYKKYFRKTSLKQEGIGEHFLNEIASKKPKNFLEIGVFHGVEHMNFFEGRSTEYSKASTQGSWTEAFS